MSKYSHFTAHQSCWKWNKFFLNKWIWLRISSPKTSINQQFNAYFFKERKKSWLKKLDRCIWTVQSQTKPINITATSDIGVAISKCCTKFDDTLKYLRKKSHTRTEWGFLVCYSRLKDASNDTKHYHSLICSHVDPPTARLIW